MEFPRQEYWGRLPFLPPGGLSDPGIKLMSPASHALQVDSLQLSTGYFYTNLHYYQRDLTPGNATPTVLLGFLLPWAWGISSRLHQQSAAIAPYLG